MKSGIYTITSPSGKKYVGSARSFDARWRKHRNELRRGTHHSPALQNAANKYGLESLEFAILLICSWNDLIFFEQRAMDVLKPRYNVSPNAGGTHGLKWTDAQRKAWSEKTKGRTFSPETIEKMRAAKIGKRYSQETKDKLSVARKGRKKSPETIARMKVAQQNRSAETRQKLSIALKKYRAEMGQNDKNA